MRERVVMQNANGRMDEWIGCSVGFCGLLTTLGRFRKCYDIRDDTIPLSSSSSSRKPPHHHHTISFDAYRIAYHYYYYVVKIACSRECETCSRACQRTRTNLVRICVAHVERDVLDWNEHARHIAINRERCQPGLMNLGWGESTIRWANKNARLGVRNCEWGICNMAFRAQFTIQRRSVTTTDRTDVSDL